MKSIKKPSETERDFPKLMVADGGDVVFFVTPACGMVVHGDGDHSLGDYSEGWDRDAFTDYLGTVELFND